MIPALRIPALQANRAPSPTLLLQHHLEQRGVCTPTLPSPWRQELGWGSQRLLLALHSPTLATPTARMAIIHLAQPALHRLGTDEAASKGRAGKQGWREAEAAPAGPGHSWEHEVSVQWDLGRAGTKQPNNSSGIGLGLQQEGSTGCSPRTD